MNAIGTDIEMFSVMNGKSVMLLNLIGLGLRVLSAVGCRFLRMPTNPSAAICSDYS